jgi:hypothetical protein
MVVPPFLTRAVANNPDNPAEERRAAAITSEHSAKKMDQYAQKMEAAAAAAPGPEGQQGTSRAAEGQQAREMMREREVEGGGVPLAAEAQEGERREATGDDAREASGKA